MNKKLGLKWPPERTCEHEFSLEKYMEIIYNEDRKPKGVEEKTI